MTSRLAVVALLLVSATTAAAQPRYIDGVFVHPGTDPIELLTYADRLSSGQMHVSTGSFEDVPILESVHRVLCSLPNWKPTGIWISTKAVFRDDRAERREMRFAARPINVYALELRIPDVETPEGVRRLLRMVRATEENPAFLFITMRAFGLVRDYMVQLSPGPVSR